MLSEEKNIFDGFADRFYQLRRNKKLTQQELGDLVGLHPTHIGKYERGLSKPSSRNARLLADVLETTVDHLMNGELDDIARDKLEDRELLNLFKEVESFSDKDQETVKRLINAFVAMKQMENRLSSDRRWI